MPTHTHIDRFFFFFPGRTYYVRIKPVVVEKYFLISSVDYSIRIYIYIYYHGVRWSLLVVVVVADCALFIKREFSPSVLIIIICPWVVKVSRPRARIACAYIMDGRDGTLMKARIRHIRKARIGWFVLSLIINRS